MFIKEIYLKNFRNYREQKVSFRPGLNVIYGDNAQGKTNLLESIYLSALGKSFKPASEKEMIFFGERFADIRVDYFSQGRDMYNTFRLFTEKKKIVTVNGVPLSKMSELVGKLTVVVFTPEELSLVKEGPTVRRRFLDMSISQIKPKYMSILSGYNKALEQKNKLLKEIKLKPSLSETIALWDEQLSQYGAKIILQRREFLKRIITSAAEFHREISMEKEELTAKYKCVVEEESADFDKTRKVLIKSMENAREKEIFLGQAVTGPHRDDVIFYINGTPAKVFGSQGQQRTVVLALKLAQKNIFFEETEEEPVLLLDDITGELDLSRREYLFSKIEDSQVFITCTDTDRVSSDENAGFYKIEGGKVIKSK